MKPAMHPFFRYWAELWSGISTTCQGLGLTLRYFFKPKVTLRYPEERPLIPAGHRGRHRFIEERCRGDGSCVTVCPVGCITLEVEGQPPQALILRYDVDYGRCLFCNLCCEVCPPKCLFLTEEYDLSVFRRGDCVRHLAREKSAAEIGAHKEKIAKKKADEAARAAAAEKAKEGA